MRKQIRMFRRLRMRRPPVFAASAVTASAVLGIVIALAGPVSEETVLAAVIPTESAPAPADSGAADSGSAPEKETAQPGSMSSGADTSQTVMYGIGSTSKTVTAAAVMKLAEEGKLDLDIPLTAYIPEFEMKDVRYREITPRMLLDHSSGIPGSTLTNAMLAGDADTYNHDHLLEALKSQRLKADPGAYSTYCNDGFSLAEILVERVSGRSFTDFLEEEFAKPLGLQNFGSPQSGFSADRLAPVYDSETGWELPPEAANVIGSGGLYATAGDICRFAQIFMENPEGGGFRLSRDSLAQMKESAYSRQLGIAGHDTVMEYGLGWDSVNTYPFNRYGVQALSKGGDTVYYHSSLTVLPEEGISCAVLSSGGSSTFNQIAVQEILLEYLDEIGRIERDEEYGSGGDSYRAPETEPEREPDSLAPETEPEHEPDSLSGKHPAGIPGSAGWYAGRELFHVEFAGGSLLLSGSGDGYARTQTYEYMPDGRFYSKGGAYISAGGSLSKGSAGRIGRSALEFIEAEDGSRYLMAGTTEVYPGLGRTAVYLPLAGPMETEEEGPLDETVWEAWKSRDGKEYYLVSDKYSSTTYFDRFMVKMELPKEPEGYLVFKDTALTAAKLKTPDRAEFFQQVPGQAGRDLSDYEIVERNGQEYLKTGSHRFLSEDEIGILPEQDAVITIGGDGDALWFASGSQHRNRQLMITVPEHGAYYIYDHGSKDMTCAASSYSGGPGRQVLLPKDGRIVFAGEAGAEFALHYVN